MSKIGVHRILVENASAVASAGKTVVLVASAGRIAVLVAFVGRIAVPVALVGVACAGPVASAERIERLRCPCLLRSGRTVGKCDPSFLVLVACFLFDVELIFFLLFCKYLWKILRSIYTKNSGNLVAFQNWRSH